MGADADVTLYTPSENYQEMFELPRMVIKAGEVIVDGGEIRATPDGVALHNAPAFDVERLPAVEEWFNKHYSLRFKNYALT
jgi:formylmethanofuran dehydrogenase subunit A